MNAFWERTPTARCWRLVIGTLFLVLFPFLKADFSLLSVFPLLFYVIAIKPTSNWRHREDVSLLPSPFKVPFFSAISS